MMQLQFLSSQLGHAPIAAPGQAAVPNGAEPGEVTPVPNAFATLLAAVPDAAPSSKFGQESAVRMPKGVAFASAVPDSAIPDLVKSGGLATEASATRPTSAVTLASAEQLQRAAHGKVTLPTGKAAPPTGKELPVAPLAALPAAPEPAEPVTDEPAEPGLKEAAAAPIPAAPQGFADLALLEGWAPQFAKLFNVAPQPQAAATQPAPAALAERQLAASVASSLPLAAIVPDTAKERPARSTAGASPLVPAAGTQSAAAPVTERAAAEISLPPLHAATLRAHEPSSQPLAVAPSPATAPLPEPPAGAGEPQPPSPVAQQSAAPAAELGPVIDRLVESRLLAREGKSELNVPHPDFGRVTLALSLAGQDRLSVAMPDAPAELRAALSQAFAPPPRSETAAPLAGEAALSSGADARGSDARREQQSSSGRSDQPRADNAATQQRQPAANREHARAASGRGVLA